MPYEATLLMRQFVTHDVQRLLLTRPDGLAGHRLLLSNKSERDVICEPELAHYLGDGLVLTFTREQAPGQQGQRIDAGFLDANVADRDGYCYVCRPDGFVEAMNDALRTIGVPAEKLVYER